MDPSALESSIKSLEESLDSLGVWLTFWTALVVLGLIVEYWQDVKDLILERPFNWKLLQTIIGGTLITVGVAGELFVQVRASGIEERLRIANHQVLVPLEREAADARRDAETARQKADSFEHDIAQANERASLAEKKAEEERLERIKLEAIVAPRSLNLEQQRLIASACAKFRGHNVLVESYGMDGEGAALGAQIIAILQAAGITVADARASTVVTGGFELGIHVRGPSAERDFVSTLGNALFSVGKLRVAINDPLPRSGSAIGGGGQSFKSGVVFVSVMIGTKPVPILASK